MLAYNICSLIIVFSNREKGEMISTTLLKSKMSKIKMERGWGDVSVDKVLTVNALEPTLGYQYLCKKGEHQHGPMISALEWGEAARFLWLAHLPAVPKG